ncbi:MAG: hypothetical protein EHM44_04155 [Ignavibacteriales bacterium]|nr:MAG: hypothetical protein EHM44_04155 [Ignavibacteriales bacterium]
MRTYFILYFFVSVFFICGCATSYSPISKLESIGDAESKNADLIAVVGIQPLGDNSRFKDTAEENKITILKLSVENISSDFFSIESKNIYLRGIPDNEPISQLSPHEVADRMSLATGTYWLWGLLWLGYTETTNNETSSLWLPIGLPIGAINFFRARSTNNSFEEEITQNAFSDVELLPGEKESGMLFFNRAGGIKYNLVISYTDSSKNKKEIIIPYKL